MPEKTTPKLILLMSASMDGFLALEGGGIDWLDPSDDVANAAGAARHRANLELLGRTGQIILGRRAYDEMASAWANSSSPMAQLINALPKLVFSSTEPEFKWENSRSSARPLREEIAELKRSSEGDVVCFGGAAIAHSLARERLIDEYRLAVHPVALGKGLPLWHGLAEPQRFRPVSTTAYPDGSVSHVLAGTD